MPRIPAYEDIGNKPVSVEPEIYFGVLAKGYVEGYVAADVWTENLPETNEDFPFDINPFNVIRESGAAAVEAAKGTVQYRVHVALHNLWAASFEKTEGETVRNILNRNYLKFLKYNNHEQARQMAGSN